jgi:hypothetical protein
MERFRKKTNRKGKKKRTVQNPRSASRDRKPDQKAKTKAEKHEPKKPKAECEFRV